MTAEDADEALNTVVSVVGDLDEEDEQSEENLGVIAGVLDQIGDLIDEGFNVTDEVRQLL